MENEENKVSLEKNDNEMNNEMSNRKETDIWIR